MKAAPEHEWKQFLKFYTKMFAGRPTRLGVFENENGTAIDFWLEDGLPLVGIDVDADNDRQTIEIMVGDLTHSIKDVKKLTAYFPADSSEDGLDVMDTSGRTTILRFEDGRTARRP